MKTINALLLLCCASAVLFAQQPTQATTLRSKRCHICVHRVVKTAALPSSTPTPAPAIDFFVGEARVDITKDQTVIRLAMAQHGSVLIELPANDGPRYIIPGDPEMATVDQKALERNKRAIVVRPGTQFLPPLRNAKARTPAATVTAQMRSGLVVTFLFYAVEDLAQNVHRCVLSYNRDEVVARRRAAGLPVNLDMESRGEMTAQSAAPTSISVENPQEEKKEAPEANPAPVNTVPLKSDATAKPSASSEASAIITPIIRPGKLVEANKSMEVAVASTREALQQATKKPKQFKHWTKPAHGITLSVVEPQGLSKEYRLLIVAIKNGSGDALKLLPSGPDLFVEMVDAQGKRVNIESIKTLHTEASNSSGSIPPGGTLYYAVAYVPPVLGSHQRIELAIGQTNAADEPASITLANNDR